MRAITSLSIILFLSACVSDPNLTYLLERYSLNGQWNVEFLDSENSMETSIEVPSNWYSQGVEYSGRALYQKSFSLDAVPDKRYWLSFEAVDYQADVALNNVPLGNHTGYFGAFEFEVTSHLLSGDNQLAVIVTSEDDPKVKDWSLNKKELKGVLNHHDTRPGGAWSDRGQDANSGGIWGDVHIESTGSIALKQALFLPELTEDNQTSARLELQLDSLGEETATINISLVPTSKGVSDVRESYTISKDLVAGTNSIQWSLPTMKRALWWPYDWGAPTLYDLSIEVRTSDGALSHQTSQRVGFRSFKYSESEKQFYVNHQKYFVRGTNYIASQWLGEVSEQDYRRDLELMKAGNINSVRVHAHVAGKPFYQMADQLGLIVWQDFPLQWGYDNSVSTAAEAGKQAREMTNQLFNHPSIAFWSGHNEPPWDATWMKYKYPSYDKNHNQLLTQTVFEALNEAEDGRVVREASYTYEHPWFGWYSGHYKDYRNIQGPPIISEFGAQAFPDLALSKEILEGDSQWPPNEEQLAALAYRNYQHHETQNLAKVNLGKSLAEYINNTQQYQRTVNKYAAEQLRLKKNNGIAVIYQFMFVDSWPSITWSVLDDSRNPKPAYFALKESFQPILGIASVNPDSSSKLINVSVINDSRDELSNVTLAVKCLDGTEGLSTCWRREGLNLVANNVSFVANIEKKLLGEKFTIELIDESGKIISSNHYQPGDY